MRLAKKDETTGKTHIKHISIKYERNEFCLISATTTPLTLFSPSSISDVHQVTEAVNALIKDGQVTDYPVVEKFINFRIHEAERQISLLNSIFKNFKTETLGNLTEDIVIPSSYWRRNNTWRSSQNAVYIPRQVPENDLDQLIILGDGPFEQLLETDQKRGAQVLRLECKSELEARYLSIFFKSNLGRLVLEASVNVNSTDVIDKERLMNTPIPIPDESSQERISSAHQSLSKLRTQINRLQSELFINPLDPETNEKITEMLSAGDNLTAEDCFRELVRLGESKTTEFKTTFQMCIRTGELRPEVETSALKSIVGFMNADGELYFWGWQTIKRSWGLSKS